MTVLLPIAQTQGIKREHLGTSVEKRETWVPGSSGTAVDRHEVRDVLREREATSPALPIEDRVVNHRQTQQIVIEPDRIIGVRDRRQDRG